MLKKTKIVLVCGVMLAVTSCGSSSSTDDGAVQGGIDGAQAGGGPGGGKRDASAGSCTALSPAGAKVAWEDNGTAECAVVVTATRTTSASQDFLEIVGGTSSGVGVALTVVSYTSPLGGTYNCKTDAGYTSQYVDFVYVSSSTLVDCTITITDPGTPGGANAVGTFSAVLSNASGGGTTTISNGSFDTPVTAS